MKHLIATLAIFIACTNVHAATTLVLQSSEGDLFIEMAGKRCANGDQPLATFMNHNIVSNRVHLTGCVIDVDTNYVTVRYTHSKGKALVPPVTKQYPVSQFTKVEK